MIDARTSCWSDGAARRSPSQAEVAQPLTIGMGYVVDLQMYFVLLVQRQIVMDQFGEYPDIFNIHGIQSFDQGAMVFIHMARVDHELEHSTLMSTTRTRDVVKLHVMPGFIPYGEIDGKWQDDFIDILARTRIASEWAFDVISRENHGLVGMRYLARCHGGTEIAAECLCMHDGKVSNVKEILDLTRR